MDNNLVGKTIQGRYYVVRQLGRGGVGVTFLAEDRQCFDSPCVVKQLKPKTSNPQNIAIARRLFYREAKVVNRLGHCDRIPQLLAYFEEEDEFFLVQELIEGHDLSHEIVAGKPWSEAQTIALLRDILEILLIVQQHNVIHRDLKPSNLMRRRQDSKIVLIDFGSVKQTSTQIVDAAGQVRQTVAIGTKSYMPIEQITGRPGFYSDIYALGIVAIQALTGINPQKLEVDNRGEIIWRNRLNSRVNYQPRFLELLDKMVRRLYQQRYTSAEAVLRDLQQLDTAQNNTRKTVIVGRNKESKVSATPQATSTISEDATLMNHPPSVRENNSRDDFSSNASNGKSKAKVTAISSPISFAPRNYHQTNKSSQAKLWIFSVVGALTLLLLGGWMILKRGSESKIELAQYENLDRGFRVDYPEEWSKQNRDDFFATGVVFFSPLTNENDRFKERVSVLVENLPREMTLEEYTRQSLAEIKQLSDPDVREAQTIALGKNEGRQVVYRGEENGGPVQRMQAWTVIGDRAYVVTYTAKSEEYDKYLPLVKQTIASFKTI